MFDANDTKYPSLQAAMAWKNFAKLNQEENESLLDYYKCFNVMKEMVERCYGGIAPLKVAEKDPDFEDDNHKAVEKEID